MFGLIAAIIFVVIKYVIVYILPFLFAGIFVFLIRKPIEFIHKKTKIGKGFLAGMILLIVMLILGAVIWYCSCFGIAKLKMLISNINFYENQLFALVHSCCEKVESNLGLNSLTIENMVVDRVNIFIDNLKIDIFNYNKYYCRNQPEQNFSSIFLNIFIKASHTITF